jgi:hypothetical protein
MPTIISSPGIIFLYLLGISTLTSNKDFLLSTSIAIKTSFFMLSEPIINLPMYKSGIVSSLAIKSKIISFDFPDVSARLTSVFL